MDAPLSKMNHLRGTRFASPSYKPPMPVKLRKKRIVVWFLTPDGKKQSFAFSGEREEVKKKTKSLLDIGYKLTDSAFRD